MAAINSKMATLMQAALGNPMELSAMFQYTQTNFSEFGGTYDAPVSLDPTAGLTTGTICQ